MVNAQFPPAVEALVEQFARLPGVGMKSAQRLAFYILAQPTDQVALFSKALMEAKTEIMYCSTCQNLTQGEETCGICRNHKRDTSLICVVADPKDVMALERSREYRGVYHVLHGVISPMQQVGPEQLRMRELVTRVGQGEVTEVIMATNPDTEGEATAMYLSRLLQPFEVKITRLAYGIPVGSHLEHTDDATLMRALEGRQEVFLA